MFFAHIDTNFQGRKKIAKYVRQLGSGYNVDNLFDTKVESITWLELQTHTSTPIKLCGAEIERLIKKNSSFACGSAIVSSSSEWSQIDTDMQEKRWVEEREIRNWRSPLYCPLGVEADSRRDIQEYNWEDGNNVSVDDSLEL